MRGDSTAGRAGASLLALAMTLACSGGDRVAELATEGVRDGGGASTSTAKPARSVTVPRTAEGTRSSTHDVTDWEDPEPPEAQALAESVVGSDWNRDKTISLAMAETSRLSMRISQLVDHRSGVEGFRSRVDGDKVSIDERLARLGAEVSDLEIVITLAGAVLFDFDRHEIRPDAERILSDVVEILQDTAPRATRVEGHTDSIGTDAYNRRLSERRAGSVREWLIGQGVADTRLRTRGHGESVPIAGNDTPEGRQQNRRVEIVIERS